MGLAACCLRREKPYPKAADPLDEERQSFLKDLGRKYSEAEQQPRSKPLPSSELAAEIRAHSEDLRGDRVAMLAAVSLYGDLLRVCSEPLRDDLELASVAVRSASESLAHCSDRLRNDRDLVLTAVRDHGLALRFASEELRSDPEVVLAAIGSTWSALQYAHQNLKDDEEIVLVAMESKPSAFCHASETLRADRGLAFQALSKCSSSEVRKLWSSISPGLKNDEDMLLLAVRMSTPKLGQWCYSQAPAALRANLPLDRVRLAAASLLACAGQEAPVLNLTLSHLPKHCEAERGPTENILCCEASLLSGSSFACTLRVGHINDDLGWRPVPNVNDLAKKLMEELPGDVKAKRVYLVFQKDNAEDVPVTVWDWDRPLSDFLRSR